MGLVQSLAGFSFSPSLSSGEGRTSCDDGIQCPVCLLLRAWTLHSCFSLQNKPDAGLPSMVFCLQPGSSNSQKQCCQGPIYSQHPITQDFLDHRSPSLPHFLLASSRVLPHMPPGSVMFPEGETWILSGPDSTQKSAQHAT